MEKKRATQVESLLFFPGKFWRGWWGLGAMASTGRNNTRVLSSIPFLRSSCITNPPKPQIQVSDIHILPYFAEESGEGRRAFHSFPGKFTNPPPERWAKPTRVHRKAKKFPQAGKKGLQNGVEFGTIKLYRPRSWPASPGPRRSFPAGAGQAGSGRRKG